ncbi:AAA family ATPase [Paenarthrobacter sp. NyZ202]|uniref:AAA family ATPase n=1 Tax=Paenarthrobacter sp. NyZ202 TaxID=3402689 RepID=UPI003CE73ACF
MEPINLPDQGTAAFGVCMLPDPWLDEETVSAGLSPTPFPDRQQLLELILAAIPSPSTNGIVVTGDRGSGKSHLLLAIKSGLPDTIDVRTFAGKAGQENTSYATLAAAAAAMEADAGPPPDNDPSGHPGLGILRAFTRTLGPAEHLYTPPPGRRRGRRPAVPPTRRPLVLLVDDIQFVDPSSLAVLLQLLPGFGATLVATADSHRPLPQDLYQLWEDGFLEQYFLPPLTFAEAHTLCGDVLGGKVQRRTSALLAAISGFNVGLMCLAVEDARRSGLLVRHDGYWTVDLGARCSWPRVTHYVQGENALLPADERHALELIALAEPLELDIVERSFGQKPVEHLLSLRCIRLLPGKPFQVRTHSWLRGEGTRLSVPPSRSRALRLGITQPAVTRESAPAMVRWMAWTLDAGLSVSDDLILSAAPAADQPATAALALRAAEGVSDPEHRDEARLIKARALVAEGLLKKAASELQRLAVPGPVAAVQVDARHRLMALDLLGGARPGWPVNGQGSAGTETRESDGGSGLGGDDPGMMVVERIHSAERLLPSGDATAALAASTAAMSLIDGDPDLEVFRPGALLRHMMCLRSELAWDQLDQASACPWDYAVPAHMAWSLEVARGYARISQGLPGAARQILEPVVAELHDAGLPPVHALASVLLAYSEACAGDAAQAGDRIRKVPDEQAEPAGGLLQQATALYRAAALAASSGDPGTLLDLAHIFQSGRAPLMEASALSLLALNASGTGVGNSFLQRLAELGGALGGPQGEATRLFATALLADDPKVLEAAGRSLSANRLFAEAALCYSRAATGYESRTRTAASRRVTLLLERLRNAFGSEAVPPLGWQPGTARC